MLPPDTNAPITLWLEELKAGDPQAATPLWHTYFARLVTLARQRLQNAPRTGADEEDVALGAFNSFCNGLAAGRFPHLDDRTDLWQVLFALTVRKSTDHYRHETRAKRGGAHGQQSPEALDAIAGPEPSPAFIVEVTEECQRLLALLDEGDLRPLAIWKMEGYTNPEIAARWGRSVATVERKLARIRAIWEQEQQP